MKIVDSDGHGKGRKRSGSLDKAAVNRTRNHLGRSFDPRVSGNDV